MHNNNHVIIFYDPPRLPAFSGSVKGWAQGQPWCHTIPYCLLTDHGHILCASALSNCHQDVDTFLFNLKCIAPVQHSEPLNPPVPSSKIPDAIRCLIVIFSPQTLLTVEVDNIIIYIAGYISHKITKMLCSKWAAGLVDLFNKTHSAHVFIAAKQYQDLSTIGAYIDRSRIP